MTAMLRPKPMLAAGAGLLAAHALPSAASIPGGRAVFRTLRRADEPQTRGLVGLTFDDGPETGAIGPFLEALDHLGAGATFFLVGEQVARAGSAPRAILDAGHEVACHGYRHRNHLRLGPRATVEDLLRARDTIMEATGEPIGCFRPPYGVFNAASWSLTAALGWRKVLWAAWGRDWEPQATPETICARVLHRIRGGDVVLLHDAERYSSPGSWRRTLGALRPVVEGLRERGLEPVPIGTLLAAQAIHPSHVSGGSQVEGAGHASGGVQASRPAQAAGAEAAGASGQASRMATAAAAPAAPELAARSMSLPTAPGPPAPS